MRFQSEFQDPKIIRPLLDELHKKVVGEYRFMEFCGGHTHALFKSGLIDLIPKNIKMIHGPGCPVCVLPAHPIKNIINLLEKDSSVMLATYADMMRVPTDKGDTLLKARSRGLSIFPIFSPEEALKKAIDNPTKNIIFLAIGFETTTPATALIIKKAKKLNIKNFYVFCQHLNTAKALEYILKSDVNLDGLIGPGHVSLITGSDFFKPYTKKIPLVISGFSAFDLASSLNELVKMKNKNEVGVKVQYSRAVTKLGNPHSQKAMDEVLELRESFEWRGLGPIPHSGFKIKEEFRDFDAENHFTLNKQASSDHPHCLCAKVLMGEKNPLDCKLFGTCTPDTPYGPCMVSSEGACSAYYQAGKR